MDAMYRVYWSREPGMIAVEAVLKAASMILCALLAVFLVPRAGVAGLAWGAVLACVLVAMGLWMTLSKLTKHVTSFSARWFWAVVCAGAALWSLPVPALAAGLCAGAGLCVWGGYAFDAWKRRRMGREA